MKKIQKNFNNLKLSIWWTIYAISQSYYLLIILLVPLINFYFTYEILLCDDGNGFPRETYYNYYGYENKPVQYQPYNPGLQVTSEGYRFELPDNSSGYPMLKVNLNGRIVYAQYSGIDYLGNYVYTYENGSFSVDSTRLGEIEPTRSEVINEAYYKGSGWGHKDVITTKYNSKPSIWNKIKADFKRTQEKAYRDRLASDKLSNRIANATRESRNYRHLNNLERSNKIASQHSHRRIRRFD